MVGHVANHLRECAEYPARRAWWDEVGHNIILRTISREEAAHAAKDREWWEAEEVRDESRGRIRGRPQRIETDEQREARCKYYLYEQATKRITEWRQSYCKIEREKEARARWALENPGWRTAVDKEAWAMVVKKANDEDEVSKSEYSPIDDRVWMLTFC